MEFDKQLLKGYIDTIILSLLKNEDRYGYDIAKQVRNMSDQKFEIKEATLYLGLKRLEKNGYISAYWSDESAGGGRRKYYSMTSQGKVLLEEKQIEWKFFKNIINLFLEDKSIEQS